MDSAYRSRRKYEQGKFHLESVRDNEAMNINGRL
jgi:hypothetical protein